MIDRTLFSVCNDETRFHLNGVLFIDHLSRLKRERVWKKFEKIARRSANEPGHPAHDSREL